VGLLESGRVADAHWLPDLTLFMSSRGGGTTVATAPPEPRAPPPRAPPQQAPPPRASPPQAPPPWADEGRVQALSQPPSRQADLPGTEKI
jgi:hypothetical protein